MTTTQSPLFYANIDMSAIVLPLRKEGYRAGDFVPLQIPCGCPHCGASQEVLIRSDTALQHGRRWSCVACKEQFLVTLFEGTSAYVPEELHCGASATPPESDDVYATEDEAAALLRAIPTGDATACERSQEPSAESIVPPLGWRSWTPEKATSVLRSLGR